MTRSDWSGVVGDLRFSNFKLIGSPDADAPLVNIPVTNTFCGIMWCSIVSHVDVFSDSKLQLSLAQPVAFEGTLRPAETSASAVSYPPNFEDLSRVVVQFDVETLSPSKLISEMPYAYSLRTWPGQPVFYLQNELSLFVNGERDRLLMDHGSDELESTAIEEPVGIGTVIGPALDDGFKPTRKMTIVTDMYLMNGQSHQAQLLHFDVMTVPEPAAWLLLVAAHVLVFVRRRARRRAA